MWHEPPINAEVEYVREKLASAGARPWQISLVSAVLVPPLHAKEPLVLPPTEEAVVDSEGAAE